VFPKKSRSITRDQVWPLSVVGGLFWFFIVCVSVRWHVSSVEFVDASFATCYLIRGTSEHGRRWAFVTSYKKFRGNVKIVNKHSQLGKDGHNQPSGRSSNAHKIFENMKSNIFALGTNKSASGIEGIDA